MTNSKLMAEIMEGLDRLAQQLEAERPTPTNADRIRAMADEELAAALLAISDCGDIHGCGDCVWHTSPLCNKPFPSRNEVYGWLKQPVEET